MNAHDWVFSDELLPAHNRSVAILELLRDTVVVRVYGCQAFESFAEARRKSLESLYTRANQRVPSCGSGRLEHADEGGAGWLDLGRLVGMPLDRTSSFP
jgi:hypothetical protein